MPLLLVRHGNTEYDHRIDALLDPPLNADGVAKIKRTAEFLKDRDFHRIITSPLQRAKKAAEMIADGNKRVTPNIDALPWNLGDLQGKVGKFVEPEVNYLLTYPDIKAPHGESYRSFYDRWSTFFQKLLFYTEIKDENLVVVTHSRNVNALQEIIGGASLGDVTERAPEASVTLVERSPYGDWTYRMIWEGK